MKIDIKIHGLKDSQVENDCFTNRGKLDAQVENHSSSGSGNGS